ncbi:MAG: pilus assembly protein [Clostridiaceae bacterium]|jgi:Flp pilus assembly protein TadG|nr:pilus assembly protein [Clostridiaceae bacterium]
MGTVIKCKKPRSKGQSLVETAIILPVILLLVLGIIDFGLIFNNYILITNASREGARLAALGGSDSEIIQTVQDMSGTLDLTKMSIDISPSSSMRKRGSQVKVKITYNAKLITPLIDKFFTDGIAKLQAESIMRIE